MTTSLHVPQPEILDTSKMSAKEKFAVMKAVDPALYEKAVEGLDLDALLYDPEFNLRPSQKEPKATYNMFGIVAGRGFGKTYTGANWVHMKALRHPGCIIFLIGRTAADVRDVMVEGPAGILSICNPKERPEYLKSIRKVQWANGSYALCFSAEESDQLRGPQASFAWADEWAAWSFKGDGVGVNAWENVKLATRLKTPDGHRPQIMFTTTPRKIPELVKILEQGKKNEKGVYISRGSTMENRKNLDESYIENIYEMYGNSRLASQELEGVLLDSVEGALWDEELLTNTRFPGIKLPHLPFKVVAVDPTVAKEPKDECGIIVLGATGQKKPQDRHAYIIEDATIQAAPEVWAKVAISKAKEYRCSIVAEKNQGGELITQILNAIDPSVKVVLVHSSDGKAIRATPVAVKYDQDKVHHFGRLGKLEDQMTTWVPEETPKSPDRIDALVHGVTALLIKPPKGLKFSGRPMIKSFANMQLAVK